MIQFNLLPDVKIAYIKTKRLKRLMIVTSIAAIIVSVVATLFSASYVAVQKRHVSNLSKDITRLKSEIESIPDLNRILTVQNQLNALPALYAGRPAVKRLPIYLDQTTPTNVSITRMSVDFSASTMEIMGQSDTLESMNKYVDTLKATNYKIGDATETKAAFSNVVLSTFGRDKDGATFTVTLSFDATIFDGAQDVSLAIDPTVTNRTQTSSGDLFNGQLEETEGNN